jgi:hypothetical protein
MLCEMPCLHVWFTQTAVKQNKGWAIWYYVSSSSLKRRSVCCVDISFLHWNVLQLILDKLLTQTVSTWVSVDTWHIQSVYGFQLIRDESWTHSVCAWVPADTWQVLDAFRVCLGISWYLTSPGHMQCMPGYQLILDKSLAHSVYVWVSADTWLGLDPFSVCRGFIW